MQTSWLFTSMAEKLNQGLPETNSTSPRLEQILSLGILDLKASVLTTGPHCRINIRQGSVWIK